MFVGPQVCFTNDFLPRAVNPDLSLKSADDWHVGRTCVEDGASIGAQSVLVTGVTIPNSGRSLAPAASSPTTYLSHALVHGVSSTDPRLGQRSMPSGLSCSRVRRASRAGAPRASARSRCRTRRNALTFS